MTGDTEQRANIGGFLIKILLFSAVLSTVGYGFIYLGYLDLGWKAFFSLQLFVLAVTSMVHIFLMQSATSVGGIKKLMFNFMLSTTIKIFIYCGAFIGIVLMNKNGLLGQYSLIQVFVVLFVFYVLYTIFELVSIVKFIKKIS